MMTRLLSPVAIFAALGMLASPVRFPAEPTFPELTAEAWMVTDLDSGVVLVEDNADEERAMASVTKMMTALVVRQHTELDERVRISEAAADVGEAEIGLVAGEVWSVRDLLAAVVIRSGNDAAVALAEYVGGSVEGFAVLMNELAVTMGLDHSHFVNPHGLDDEAHYTSARDLTTIAIAALEDEVLAQLTRTRLIRFKPAPTGENRVAVNTNRLLGRYPGVIGMKTGYTGNAGRVLISVLESQGHTFVVVVMGSEDHFADTGALLDFVTSRISIKDRFLAPLVEQEGGGGISPSPLDAGEQAVVKTLQPLATGLESTTPWGETPGARAIEDMIRDMIPATLGGSG
jgi:D-alanyl-D-alanine carboxypeptidase